ncbi:hypothetical protein DEFR109230_16695 [Deinococcus frigens]
MARAGSEPLPLVAAGVALLALALAVTTRRFPRAQTS